MMTRLMHSAWPALLALTTALAFAGCAVKAQAHTEVELPALDPPPPPPRVIAEYPPEEKPEPAPPVATETASTPRPVERPARPDNAKPEPAKPETEPPPPPAPRPSLTITPTPGTEAQTEAAIRRLLAKASRDLARANPASLGTDGRAQFDTAKRFLQQAEEALKSKNLVYASTLADKASTLAAVFAR